MTINDPFALEEGGGGLDGFTGTITDAYYQDGDYGLSLVIKSTFDDPENYVKFEDGTFTHYYSCGKDWTTPDGGETATHPGGPDKRFNKSSKAGQFVAAVAQIPGIADAVPADFSVYNAKSWKGLHLEWGRVPTERRKQINGEWTTTIENVLFPVAIAGQGGTASSNGTGTVDVNSLGLTTEQVNVLSVIAQTADTDGKFIEALAKHPDVMGNSTFMGAVSKNTKGVREALAAATF